VHLPRVQSAQLDVARVPGNELLVRVEDRHALADVFHRRAQHRSGVLGSAFGANAPLRVPHQQHAGNEDHHQSGAQRDPDYALVALETILEGLASLRQQLALMGFERSDQFADAIHLPPADSGTEHLHCRARILRAPGSDHIAGERELRTRERRELLGDLLALALARELREPVELTFERALGGVVRGKGFLAAGQHVALRTDLGVAERSERGAQRIERRASLSCFEVGGATDVQLAQEQEERRTHDHDQQQRRADRQPETLANLGSRHGRRRNESRIVHNEASLLNTSPARSCASASRSTACSRSFASTAVVS
jgi:hypothetical protein